MAKRKRRGPTPSDKPLTKITVLLFEEDVERVKARAKALAVPYQAYLRTLLHSALTTREEVKLK